MDETPARRYVRNSVGVLQQTSVWDIRLCRIADDAKVLVDIAGCTFEVAAYTTDRAVLPLQLWVEDEECERPLGAPAPTIAPIKSAKLADDVLQMQLYAEC